MEAVSKEFVRNRLSILIVKCCASCRYRVCKGEDKYRHCKLGYGKHRLDYLCQKGWEMDPSLDNAGRGGGRVKKKSYIEFMLEHGFGRADEYERLYGSRYLTKK